MFAYFLQFGPKLNSAGNFGCFGMGEYTIRYSISKKEAESKEKQAEKLRLLRLSKNYEKQLCDRAAGEE